MGVENGRAGLEGGGDAVLERRHGLDLIEGITQKKLSKGECERDSESETVRVVAPEMPLPSFFDVWSCPSSRVKKKNSGSMLLLLLLLPPPSGTRRRGEQRRAEPETTDSRHPSYIKSFGKQSQQSYRTKNNTGRIRNVT